MSELLPIEAYKVTSLIRADINGQEWYEYIISNSHTSIKGQRRGTLIQVNQHTEEYLEQLNWRANGNYSTYRSRNSFHQDKKKGSKKS